MISRILISTAAIVGGFFTIRATVRFLRILDHLDFSPWPEDDPILCGQCSDDMGVVFDTWHDAADIDPASRIYCDRCGR